MFLITDGTPLMHGQHTISKQKHPETYRLTAVQAIAHGANSIQYYQWRQSRGGSDKFQAAVISHNGKSDTRVFKQVSDTGVMLDALSTVCDSTVEAKVAIVYDIENLWAINAANGSEYTEAVLKHYSAFWRMGIPVDIIDMNTALEEYKLVIAPMAYMLKKGFDKKLKRFTFDGGVLVTTFFSFMTNENDLCYLGETPALGLSELNGIILEDVDALGKRRSNSVCMVGSSMGLSGSYEAKNICELIHIKTAEVLGVYGDDFYKDEPVFTVNEFGSGWAYYIGTDVEQRFFDDFYAALCNDLGIEQSIITELPFGVTVGKRRGAGGDLYFLQNFSNEFKSLKLPFKLEDIVNRTTLEGSITLSPYEAHICKRWLKLEAL